MSDGTRYPLTAPFRPVEIYRLASRWLPEPWCLQRPAIRQAFTTFLDFVSSTLEAQSGSDELFIHIYYVYDSEGKHLPFRRIDLLRGLYRWVLEFATSEIPKIQHSYGASKIGLHIVELHRDPHTDLDPVPCTLSHSLLWGNIPTTWV